MVTNANRLCTNCDQLETVEHFLFVCPKYSDIRKPILDKIENIDKDFSKKNIDQKCKYILNFEFPFKYSPDLEKNMLVYKKNV